jgi:hypothetical protein
MNKFVAISIVLFSITSFAKRIQVECEDGPAPIRFTFMPVEINGENLVNIQSAAFQGVVPEAQVAPLFENNPDITEMVGFSSGDEVKGAIMITEGGSIGYGRETVDISIVVPAAEGKPSQMINFYNCFMSKQNQIGFQ